MAIKRKRFSRTIGVIGKGKEIILGQAWLVIVDGKVQVCAYYDIEQ